MKHVWKLGTVVFLAFAAWIALLYQQYSPRTRDILLVLPVYAIFTLGCYGLAMVGYGLMVFPTCPQEAVLLMKDIGEARVFLQSNGIDVS